MEQLNFHKQKLYSLVIAGIALISLLLPWQTVSFGGFGSASANGFHSWGLLAVIGVIAVAAISWMGNKAAPYDDNSKKIAMGGFGAIALGALISLVSMPQFVKGGIGLWLGLIAGAAGLALLLGFIKIPEKPNNPPKV
jgi:hypothetical protein